MNWEYAINWIFFVFAIYVPNSIQEEIKCRLKAANSCYYSVQILLSSRLLSKNLKITICKTIILPVVLRVYDCETLSLILRKECRLRVFENRILRRIFGPKRDEEIGINAGNRVGSAQDINYWRALVNAALNLRVP